MAGHPSARIDGGRGPYDIVLAILSHDKKEQFLHFMFFIANQSWVGAVEEMGIG